ncbi:MAG: hypothetical protein HKN90_00680 [Flavobacteriaceae bacterium]|nr:hypothetical protein [Flavobacteriaceae bacterium]
MYRRILCLVIPFLLIPLNVFGQEILWTKLSSEKASFITNKNLPESYEIYQLDIERLRSKLVHASKRNENSSDNKLKILFPDSSGKLKEYDVQEASIMHPDLAKKFPQNKSYVGQATHDKGTSIRFSLNSLGFYAMISSAGESTVYIDPVSESKMVYALYSRKSLNALRSFECLTKSKAPPLKAASGLKNANDLQLRTFELALATTGEYAQFHIDAAGVSNGTEAEKRAAVMDAMTVTMTRVNGLFERDVALTMQLVPNNDLLIYLDGGTDPYTNENGSAMLTENQTNIDTVIGSTNYDIGHVFSTGGGGVAFLGSPCGSSKAGGVTGLPNPVGDVFDVEYVAHEMGHQYGANHTFNGTAGNCAGANRNGPTAVEPGSGTTIMAYAGICAPQNVQQNGDDYFHSISIKEMFAFISSGSSVCDDETAFINNANAPLANAGSDFVVPVMTPLELKGQASDADGDVLTYTWEQIDNEISGISIPPSSTQTVGAVFRSLPPDDSLNRFLPDLNTVVNGNLSSTWEVLPSVGRTMNFSFTVRDNALAEGQSASDETVITVDENSGPFLVTSQDAKDVYWAVGSSQTISWDVANTDVAPVNSPTVHILLSLDGGFTYPITLAASTPNDGNHIISVPNNLTSTARVKVEGANHIFYALNKSDINIVDDFALNITDATQIACIPDNAVFDFSIDFAAGFSETINFNATNVPAGASASFNPASANSNSNVQLTISGIDNVIPDSYDIQIIGSTTMLSRQLDIVLNVFDPIIKEPIIKNPIDGATGVKAIGTSFTWDNDTNVTNYDLEIATDVLFNTVIESVNVTTNSYIPQNLQDATTYYWRLRPNNPCASGNFSKVRTFTTSEIICIQYNATDTPLNIPDNDPMGINSVINVADDFVISDVNVTITITHPWMEDIVISLESPLGTSVGLINRQCNGASGNQNMAATFDDL